MTTFILIAALLVSVALGFVAIPLFRDTSRRGLIVIASSVVFLMAGSAALYWKLGKIGRAHV